MRLRNIKGAEERLEQSEYIIKNAENNKGRWNEIFGNNNSIYTEIGMGKGRFITDLAIKYPNKNFIGIEKFSSVIIRAVEKQEELKLPNLYFIRMEAEDIEKIFERGEIAGVYLNFSDPWPKDRHAKRRLTSKEFFKRYNTIIVDGGKIEFKTDNNPLFEFSLEEIENTDWEIEEYTRDLHKSGMKEDNIMTEYEERFSKEGNPINYLKAKRKNSI